MKYRPFFVNKNFSYGSKNKTTTFLGVALYLKNDDSLTFLQAKYLQLSAEEKREVEKRVENKMGFLGIGHQLECNHS